MKSSGFKLGGVKTAVALALAVALGWVPGAAIPDFPDLAQQRIGNKRNTERLCQVPNCVLLQDEGLQNAEDEQVDRPGVRWRTRIVVGVETEFRVTNHIQRTTELIP